jgi:hypothetical protein
VSLRVRFRAKAVEATAPTRIGSRGRTAEGVETVVVPVIPGSAQRRAGARALVSQSHDATVAVYCAMTSPEALEEGR